MRASAACLFLLLAWTSAASACPLAGTADAVRLKIPVDGVLTSGFGLRLHPILQIKKMHTGTDWAAEPGTPVKASAAGEVITAGRDGAYGNLVVIRHGVGVETAYAHLSRISVKEGDCVQRDAVIGGVGSTGLSDGPKLHFEVRRNGVFVDPLAVLADSYEGTPREP